MINLSQLNYTLPKNNIAQSPAIPRDKSKLMIIDRARKITKQCTFSEITSTLKPDDVLVFNNSKVFPARLSGIKDSGGMIEILFIKEVQPGVWEALHKGKILKNQQITFLGFSATVLKVKNELTRIRISLDKEKLFKVLETSGITPLPPYIGTHGPENITRKQYQTVYALANGSVAAPTAGFHFTTELLRKIKKMGIQTEFVTLHVGPGTFSPIREENISNHQMHSEWFSLDADVTARLNKAKATRRRIIAVGTTTTRVLESCTNSKGILIPENKETAIFIYPPYKFRFVDAMITNFHLPKSTLLALISAFVSYPNTPDKFVDFTSSLVGEAYRTAINNNFRFYSFGDACFII